MDFGIHLKNRILVQDRGGVEFKTAGNLLVVEDLKRGINKDMGPKDIFGMDSMVNRQICCDALCPAFFFYSEIFCDQHRFCDHIAFAFRAYVRFQKGFAFQHPSGYRRYR